MSAPQYFSVFVLGGLEGSREKFPSSMEIPSIFAMGCQTNDDWQEGDRFRLYWDEK